MHNNMDYKGNEGYLIFVRLIINFMHTHNFRNSYQYQNKT